MEPNTKSEKDESATNAHHCWKVASIDGSDHPTMQKDGYSEEKSYLFSILSVAQQTPFWRLSVWASCLVDTNLVS